MSFLAGSLAGAARRFGDRPALVDAHGAVVTYTELEGRAAALAGALAHREGVGEGTVVCLRLPSDPTYVVTYAALARLGAVTAGINPRLAPPEQDAVVAATAPDVVLDPDRLAPLLAASHEPPLPRPDDPERVVAIVFTSGTAGRPKGAVFRDRQLAGVTRLDLGGLDVWDGGAPMLASTQFAHVGFMTKLAWYFRTGSTMVLQDRWRAALSLRLVEQHRMPSVGGIAPQFALMLRVPGFADHDLACVRTLIAGGAPSPPELVVAAREGFGAAYSIRYSSTESGGIGTGTAFDADDTEALHTVGRPRPGVEVRIGAGGVVELRSDAVMSGYWRGPERTAEVLDGDGWLRTGDLGTIDDRGCLRLLGRATDMYIRGGYNVHPQPVEAVLRDHPAIADVAVVPRPDPVMGEIGVAVVVPAPGRDAPTLTELREFAAGRLATYELPEAMVTVPALPLTSVDKVDRAALRVDVSRP